MRDITGARVARVQSLRLFCFLSLLAAEHLKWVENVKSVTFTTQEIQSFDDAASLVFQRLSNKIIDKQNVVEFEGK